MQNLKATKKFQNRWVKSIRVFWPLIILFLFILQVGLAGSLGATSYYIDVVIQFDENQSEIKEKYQTELANLVPMMEKGPYGKKIKKLLINGHADSQEKDPIKLSKQRASAVKKRLIQMGVAPSRLEIKGGHGSKLPIADPKTSEGRTKNRRVDFDYELEDWD